jgi:hypothetical protein
LICTHVRLLPETVGMFAVPLLALIIAARSRWLAPGVIEAVE